MKNTTTWARSVEKARLALVKTFEGRVEAALASFEQIPPGSGRGGSRERGADLAQFALDAGIEYTALMEYRSVTKWLGSNSARAEFDVKTARYRIGDIGNYSLAREAMNSKKWANGTLFVAFMDSTTPPEEIAKNGRWTVDALRVHLNRKPTNTGTLALRIAEGEKVNEDDVHVASAKDKMADVTAAVEAIENPRVHDDTKSDVVYEAVTIPRRGKTVISEHNTTVLDGTYAELTIANHLDEALMLARQFNKQRYLLEELQDMAEKVEHEIEHGTPAEAVAELEQWLANQ